MEGWVEMGSGSNLDILSSDRVCVIPDDLAIPLKQKGRVASDFSSPS